MSSLAIIIPRFVILLFIMLFNFFNLAFSHFKWFLEFILYHPFHTLRVHHHQQPLHQEFQIFTEDGVEIWRHRRHEEEEEGEEGEGEVDCAVCLSKIGEGDEVRVLKCKHVFHRDCLNQWVALRNYNCPLCRDFMGSSPRIRAANEDEGRQQVHVIFFKFSSFSGNSEPDNWWLR